MATTTGTVTNATSASYVEYSNVADKPALISGSSQVSYTGLSNIPAGIVSGSTQVSFNGIVDKPALVSSSAQIGEYGVFATTGSNQFNGSQAITGSLTVTGQVVAQTLNVQQVTSSIVYSSGSNIFGNSLGNTQQFTGSVSVTGSLTVNGAGTFASSVDARGDVTIGARTADTDSILQFSNGSDGQVRIIAQDFATDGRLGFWLNQPGVGFTERMVIKRDTGNVGIGTASPDRNLEVETTSDTYLRVTGNRGNADGVHVGNLEFYNSNTSRIVGEIRGITGTGVTQSNSGQLAFYTNDNGTYAERFRIASTGAATFSSPNNLITDGSDSNIEIRSTTAYGANIGSSIGFGGFFNNSASANFAVISGKKENATLNNLSGYLAFYTRGALTDPIERMRITSGGNILLQSDKVIGLNTTDGSDTGYLAIAGASGDGVNRGGHIYLSGNERVVDAGNIVIAAGNISSGTGTPGAIVFRTGNGVERMRVASDGTVGFNSNSAEANAGLDKISIGHSGTYGWIQSWNATPLYLNGVGNAVYAGTQRIDNNSDARIKENIESIPNALTTILSLQGRKFNMLDEDGKLRYGFVAQEVQEHLSDFVTESDRYFKKDDITIENLLTLESSGTAWAALLVEAIKELKSENDNLKSRLEVLEQS
jgi:hypothetical protein